MKIVHYDGYSCYSPNLKSVRTTEDVPWEQSNFVARSPLIYPDEHDCIKACNNLNSWSRMQWTPVKVKFTIEIPEDIDNVNKQSE